MMQYSVDYKEYVATSLNIDQKKIKLVPQGVGAKVAYDRYGHAPSSVTIPGMISKNYLGIDIGFNTVDVYQVINGATSSSTVEGLMDEGISKASKMLIDKMRDSLDIVVDIQECKSIISTNKQTIRSVEHDRTEIVAEVILNYLINLIEMVESKYKSQINKMDNIILVGVVLVCGLQQCNGASRSLVEVYLLTANAASLAVAEGSCADVCRFLQGDGSGV
jgi:hypothetical protein